MRSWGVGIGMMGPKFWQLYRKEGLMRTLLRGKPYRPTHEKAGFGDELATLVGTDDYGNRYYEDFNGKNKNQRRFVEFADYGKWFPGGMANSISPAWHGWMHYTYDDPPKVRTSSHLLTLLRSIERQLRRPILAHETSREIQE